MSDDERQKGLSRAHIAASERERPHWRQHEEAVERALENYRNALVAARAALDAALAPIQAERDEAERRFTEETGAPPPGHAEARPPPRRAP